MCWTTIEAGSLRPLLLDCYYHYYYCYYYYYYCYYYYYYYLSHYYCYY